MLSIAICDDDTIICTTIESIILEYSKKIGLEVYIEVYFSGEKLIKDLMDIYYDIIFLDIQLKELSGIEVGKQIRNKFRLDSIEIIFISSYKSYALELFKIRPSDFLIKPLNTEEIIDILDRTIQTRNISMLAFSYKIGRTEKKICIKDILYFESKGQSINIHTEYGDIKFYGTLKKTALQLQQIHAKFLYCHKSFIVNYNQIVNFRYDFFTLTNGIQIPIGECKRKEVRKTLCKYERGKFE